MTTQTITTTQPVETQAEFDARQAEGRAERLTRKPAQDPFRRLPVHEDIAF